MTGAASNELPRWIDLVLLPAVNLTVALLVAGIVVLLVGQSPGQVLTLLIKGAFGSRIGVSYTFYYATTFVFTGLAVAVAFHGGLFNIGGEGQAMLGGLGASLAALSMGEHLPAWAMLPIMVGAAALFGMAWAAVPAVLQAYRGSHVVITTIMFNFIASALLAYLLVDVLKAPGNMTVETRSFAPSAHMPGVHEVLAGWGIEWPRSPLNLSVLLAAFCALGVYLMLWRSRPGYSLRAVGHAPDAAHYAGIHPRTQVVVSMALSGALAGLVGINEVAGVHGRLLLEFVAGAGFAGIADRAQPPGRHRARVAAVRRALPGRRRTGVRDPGLQPRHGLHATRLDRAVLRRDGAGGRADAGAHLVRAATPPRRGRRL
jgi:general nucleoside transport system permease protein